MEYFVQKPKESSKEIRHRISIENGNVCNEDLGVKP